MANKRRNHGPGRQGGKHPVASDRTLPVVLVTAEFGGERSMSMRSARMGALLLVDGRSEGEPNSKRAAPTDFALEEQAPLMCLDERSRDEEPQSESLGTMG